MGLTKEKKTMVFILLAGAFLAVLNQTLLSPALPTIMEEFSIPNTTVQWLLSAYSLVEAILIPLSAFLLGRFSTRKLFISAFSLFSIGAALVAWSPTFTVALIGRICQATCTAVAMPLVFTLVLLIFPRDKRGAAMGLVGLIIGFAPAVGPAVSGVIIDNVGWHALFVIVTVLSLLILVASIFALKNYGEFERSKFDVLSVLLSSIGLIGLLFGLSSFSSSDNPVLIACLVVIGILFIALFVRRQTKLEQPILKIDVLKTKNYRSSVVLIFLMQGCLIGLASILPLFIQNVCGYSATISGFTILPGALLGALTSLLAGRMFDRFGVRGIAVGGTIVTLIGAVCLFMLTADSSFILTGLAYGVFAIGLQAAMMPINTWGINSLDNHVIQHANALGNTINQVAASFATAALISISALASGMYSGPANEGLYFGYHVAFGSIVVLFIIATVLCIAKVRDRAVTQAPVAKPSESVQTVTSAMNAKAATIPSTATVREALLAIAATDTSGVPIVGDNGELAGFISDGDIMKYLGNNNVDVAQSFYLYNFSDDEDLVNRVAELMSKNVMDLATKQVISVDEAMPLEEACRILAERRIKKVPVTAQGKVIGALSRRNIIRSIVESLPAEA